MDEFEYLKMILSSKGYMNQAGKVNYHLIYKDTGIPERTFRSWIEGSRRPPDWVLRLLNYYLS